MQVAFQFEKENITWYMYQTDTTSPGLLFLVKMDILS